MLKNKFKVIALLLVLILSLSIPIVRAENEVTSEDPESSITVEPTEDVENEQSNDAETEQNEDVENDETDQTGDEENTADEQVQSEDPENTMKKQDVYIVDDDVVIDYIVDGNLYVIANNVTINSQIGGDAFIIAQTINIDKDAYIYSNLFSISSDLNITGVIYDLYAMSKNINIDGYIYRDIRVATNDLNINGVVGRNAYVTANNINFESGEDEANGVINGNFNYTSSQEISIPDDSVNGEVNYSEQIVSESHSSISSYIMSLGGLIASVLIIWGLSLWLTPKFIKNASELIKTKPLKVYGFGLLTPIVSLLVISILFLLGLTAKIALILTGLLILAFALSTSIFIITINELICQKFKIEKNHIKIGTLILTALVFWIIALIPYIKILANLVVYLGGLGLLIINIIPSKKD